MSNFQLSQTINAPVGRVFAIAIDIPNTPRIFPQIVRIEPLTPGPVAPGYHWRETRKAMGREATVELTISELVPDESFTVVADVMNIRFDTRFRFSPSPGPGGGGTRLDLETTATPRGLIARLMAGMMSKPMAQGLREDVESLKRAAENA